MSPMCRCSLAYLGVPAGGAHLPSPTCGLPAILEVLGHQGACTNSFEASAPLPSRSNLVSRNNRKGGTASLRSQACVKRSAVFGARFKGLSLYFLYQKRNQRLSDTHQNGLGYISDTYPNPCPPCQIILSFSSENQHAAKRGQRKGPRQKVPKHVKTVFDTCFSCFRAHANRVALSKRLRRHVCRTKLPPKNFNSAREMF